MRRYAVVSLALILSCARLNQALAGTAVICNDEWQLSNTGFARAPDAAIFARNIAAVFTGGVGKLHAYSNNFSLTQSGLITTLKAAGHSYTTGTAIQFDLPTLLGYDGIFLAGDLLNASQITTLIQYVKSGGNVYLAAGTSSNSVPVVNAWNPFLNEFGLAFVAPVNSLLGNIDVSGATHRIFSGVSALYHDRGNSIIGLTPEGQSAIRVTRNGHGLFAVVEVGAPAKNRITLPTSANVAGQFGAFFRTRVSILNVTQTVATVEATLFNQLGHIAKTTISVGPRQQRTFGNFLGDVFGATGAGAVRLESEALVKVTAEVYTDGPGGRFKTIANPAEPSDAIHATSAAVSPGIIVDANSRTNIGCFNESPLAQTVSAEIYDASGLLVNLLSLPLAANGWDQTRVTGFVSNGYVRWRPQAECHCYAVVVDNTSNDRSSEDDSV
jgi:hypothetical protein